MWTWLFRPGRLRFGPMHRSEITIDLCAVRRNARTLLRALDGAALWAVVTANGYGNGAVDVAAAAIAPFPEQQIGRSARAPAGSGLTRHIANSAGALRYPSARFDAARCGIALYGLSPFGEEPARDGLEPVLRWESHLAQVKRLAS